MAQLPTGIVTHSQKVCSLYKRALYCLRDWYPIRLEFRYRAVKLRKEFDDNASIKDLRLAKHLLLKAEEELFQRQHLQPFKHVDSPGGVAHEREVDVPDIVLDSWDPMEKAMYPKYFARREERKKEFLEWYYKTYPEKRNEKPH